MRARVARCVGPLAVTAAMALAGCGVRATDDLAGPGTIASTTTAPTASTSASTTTPTTTRPTTTTAAPTSTTTATSTPTTATPEPDGDARATFLEQANRICREGADALAGREPDVSDDAAMAAYVRDTFVPAVRRQLSDISALGFPPGDEAVVGAIIDDTRAALDRLAADPIGVINSGRDPFGDVNVRLNAYGLTDCGAS